MNWRGAVLWVLGSLAALAVIAYLFPAKSQMPLKPPKPQPVELTEYQKVMPVKCYKYEELVSQLQGQYQEQMKEGGDSSPNRGEFWKSRAGATWTWVLRLNDGLACIVGAGTNWRK